MITFTNELGNKITIDVSEHNEGVRIYIAGPTSECENIITRKEAEYIRDGLDWLLG